MIDCGTAGWPTVEQVSRQHCLLLRAADVTACLGSDRLSETVINDSISLDMMGALSHLHWQMASTLLSMYVFFYRPQRRENTCQSNLSRGTARLFIVSFNTHCVLNCSLCYIPWCWNAFWFRDVQKIVTASMGSRELLISSVTEEFRFHSLTHCCWEKKPTCPKRVIFSFKTLT